MLETRLYMYKGHPQLHASSIFCLVLYMTMKEHVLSITHASRFVQAGNRARRKDKISVGSCSCLESWQLCYR